MKFLEIFGFFENRVFLQIVTDRGWGYILGYIGGQKKGHFRRFCGLLPIFFYFLWIFGRKWESEICDKILLMNNDEIIKNISWKKICGASHLARPAPLGLAGSCNVVVNNQYLVMYEQCMMKMLRIIMEDGNKMIHHFVASCCHE